MGVVRRVLVAVASLALGLSTQAHAETPPAAGPWVDEAASLPEWARSVRILRSDETLLVQPTKASERRGSAAREALLPLYGAHRGAGCRAPWLAVGPWAWVCGDDVELSRGAPLSAQAAVHPPSSDGLPFRYYFVGPDGSFGYKQLEQADHGVPDFQLEPGFAVAITEERSLDGQRYGRSGNDLWLPMRDLSPTRPFAFQGSEIAAEPSGPIPVAWVVAPTSRVFHSASRARPRGESLAQFVKVDWLEEAGQFERFVRIGEDRWVAARDLRHPTIAPPPSEVDVAAKERWIDVELATQTLVAYEGERPTFATLVSTGKGRPGTANGTPLGTFRIWVKLTTSNMDNLEDENARRYYRMESVPWVQYFDKGVGLHGAFWHRGFGQVRSHGCVNLAPLDAQRLFSFTSPRLPAGWTAVLPSERERGTVVRVR